MKKKAEAKEAKAQEAGRVGTGSAVENEEGMGVGDDGEMGAGAVEDVHVPEVSEKQLQQWLHRKKEREELREKHKAPAKHRPKRAFFKGLDGTVKKTTAFIKKLKSSITEQQRQSVLSDFEKLNLAKFLGEVATALVDAGLTKNVDLQTALILASKMHCRYADFDEALLEAFNSSLNVPEPDDKDAMAKYKFSFLFYIDCVLLGLFGEGEGKQLAKRLAGLVQKDKTSHHVYLPLINTLLAAVGEELLGITPRSYRRAAEKLGMAVVGTSTGLYPVVQEQLVTFLCSYFETLSELLLKQKEALNERLKLNHATYQTKGEVREEHMEKEKALRETFQSLRVHVAGIADTLDKDMPELPEFTPQDVLSEMNMSITNPYLNASEEEVAAGIWEDAETRDFYESLIDLERIMPGVLFHGTRAEKRAAVAAARGEEQGDGSEEPAGTDAGEQQEQAVMEDEAAVARELSALGLDPTTGNGDDDDVGGGGGVDAPPTDDAIDEDEEDEEGTEDVARLVESSSVAPEQTFSSIIDIIHQLPNCNTTARVDELAKSFCYKNTKKARGHLVDRLYAVTREEMELIPYYARLVATLQPVIPEVADGLADKLLKTFRFLRRKLPISHFESKLRNARYVGELTKFRVIDGMKTLHHLQLLLRTFRGQEIDTACMLLETCGRFLYRSPETHVRTRLLLEVMKKKRAQLRLSESHRTMIDNALLYCNPPDVAAFKPKERPPLHEYLRKLLYADLKPTSKAITTVAKQLRKLPWNDKEFLHYGVKSFTRVWIVNFSTIPAFASLLALLKRHLPIIPLMVVDAVCEEMRVGMEINDPRLRQRRTATARYFAEMYTFELVNDALLIKVLYSLITFGAGTHLDPPKHYFRIRLVCEILNVCNEFFTTKRINRKLDSFLVFFQRYILSKKQPLPIDVDFSVSEMMEAVRPSLTLYKTLEDAEEAVAHLRAQQLRKHAALRGLTVEELQRELGVQGARELSMSDAPDEEEDDDDDDEEEEEEDVESDGREDEDDGEEAAGTGRQRRAKRSKDTSGASEADPQKNGAKPKETSTAAEKPQPPEDAKFVQQFSRMMADAGRSAKKNVSRLDVTMPMDLHRRPIERVTDEEGEKVKFTLLTKQKTHTFHLPTEMDFTTHVLKQHEAELKERAKEKEAIVRLEQQAKEEEFIRVEEEEQAAQFARSSQQRPQRQQRRHDSRSRGRGRRGPQRGGRS